LLVAVVAFALVSAAAASLAGLHEVLGAFIAGSVLPASIRERVLARLEHGVALLFAPFFFFAAGLKVQIDGSSVDFAALVGVTTAAAVAGKFVGTLLPARAAGLSWREGGAIASLVQAKGMMELAVLLILLDVGLISGTLYSALTVMALITTALAMPAARLFLAARWWASPVIPD
jgi:Kef-type K+ transport system membrane component KefB